MDNIFRSIYLFAPLDWRSKWKGLLLAYKSLRTGHVIRENQDPVIQQMQSCVPHCTCPLNCSHWLLLSALFPTKT